MIKDTDAMAKAQREKTGRRMGEIQYKYRCVRDVDGGAVSLLF